MENIETDHLDNSFIYKYISEVKEYLEWGDLKSLKKYKNDTPGQINEDKDKKHDRLIFNLSNNQKLIYNDVRKFGFIKFFKSNNIDNNAHIKNLGPEPLSTKFNISYFKNYILKRNRTIKDILMDQKFVSGLGNIYVNEILFYSGIRPIKKVSNLTNKEIKKIIQ